MSGWGEQGNEETGQRCQFSDPLSLGYPSAFKFPFVTRIAACIVFRIATDSVAGRHCSERSSASVWRVTPAVAKRPRTIRLVRVALAAPRSICQLLFRFLLFNVDTVFAIQHQWLKRCARERTIRERVI